MDEVSLNDEPLFRDDGNEYAMERECETTEFGDQNGVTQEKKEPVPPAVGMEFDSYDEVYNFYKAYGKELGFGIRVKNSWFREKTKEKYCAILCCSSEGFKKKRETTRVRSETRTGCPAMVRIKLVSNFRWKVTEVALEHNHNPASVQHHKSQKSMAAGKKRKLRLDSDGGILTNKSHQKHAVNVGGFENLNFDGRVAGNIFYPYKRLELKEGDAQAIYNYFCRMQLTSPNFFYSVDFNNEGFLRNVFWADARSRVAYGYFGDVVAIDTTYLTNKFEVPCVPFVGLNHHGQSVLLGCGFLVEETFDSFVWLFKAWLTCMSGHIPFVIITDQCKTLQKAVAEVFPRARHCFSLWHIMHKAPQKLRGLRQYEAIRRALNKATYESFRVEEFDTAWKDMIQQYGVGDQEWLQMLYESRQHWVPVFLKDILFAGISTTELNECMNAFFDGYVHKHTSLKEFFGKYESVFQKKRQTETREDFDSMHSNPILKTRCCFELQLSKVYTKEMFKKFQYEVEELYSCFNTSQVHSDGPIATYIVKERREGEGNKREIRDYEVWYNASTLEVCCICGLFNFKGYLCRHSLSVLNYNGVEEIPSQYILPRWRKDFKRIYVPNHGPNGIDVNYQEQWYDHLYKRAIQIVEEGAISQEHFKVALIALEESLDRVHLVEDIELSTAPAEIQPSSIEKY